MTNTTRYVIILSTLLSLTACMNKIEKPTPLPTPTVHIDGSLKQLCPKLDSFPYTVILPLDQFYTAYSDLQAQYAECAIRMGCLVSAVDNQTTTCKALLGVVKNATKQENMGYGNSIR